MNDSFNSYPFHDTGMNDLITFMGKNMFKRNGKDTKQHP